MNTVHLSSKICEWETPRHLFKELDALYYFTLGPCATAHNAKGSRYYTGAENGLLQQWQGIVFMNPTLRQRKTQMKE